VLLVNLISAVLWPVISIADTEIRKFVVEIRNSEDEPMRGVRVKCRGHSEFSGLSSPSGLAELPLPPGAAPGDLIRIELEPGTEFARDWVFLQPYGGNFYVPSLTQRYYEIRLIQRERLEAMLTKERFPRSENTERNVDVDRFDGLSAPLDKNRKRKRTKQ
jgi:hypothetical protein